MIYIFYFILASIAAREYDRLKEEYEITVECFDSSCFEIILNKNISIVSIICSSVYSISIQYEFYEVFFNLLYQQIHVLLSNCENYLPYSKVIDYSHPSSSLPWIYTIYFQTFERRFQTLIEFYRNKKSINKRKEFLLFNSSSKSQFYPNANWFNG